MSIRKMALVAALGLSMASAPVMAQTSAPTTARAGVGMEDSNDQGRGRDRGNAYGRSATTYIVAFFVIIAIGLGIYVALQENEPGQTSP
jgi:hypothetical protein